MWVGLVNPDLKSCASSVLNDCDNKFRWLDDNFTVAAHLEDKVDADREGVCFAMNNEAKVRDRSCRTVAKFACEFSCEQGE